MAARAFSTARTDAPEKTQIAFIDFMNARLAKAWAVATVGTAGAETEQDCDCFSVIADLIGEARSRFDAHFSAEGQANG